MFENAIKIYQQLQKKSGEEKEREREMIYLETKFDLIPLLRSVRRAGGPEDYLMTLAKDLLSLESPTRGKFILLSSLSQHLPADKFLLVSPQLPVELLSVMGHQALACHVRSL